MPFHEDMKQSLALLVGLLASVFFSSCGRESSPTASTIDKSDYSRYSDYWYDKSLAEVGETTVEVESDTFDFGVMPPSEEGTRRFKLKNVGRNPLVLLAGPKSCKCTALKIIDREIAPGATGEVEVRWETVPLAETFRHSASVYTNDPNQKEVKLQIVGHVGVEAGIDPTGFSLGRINPDMSEASSSIIVYSDEFERFEIQNGKTSFAEEGSLEVFDLTAEEISEAKSKYYGFKSGKRLKLTVKRPEETGDFSGNVVFNVVTPEKSIEREVAVAGKVVRRIRLEETESGTLHPSGLIMLDRVPRQLGKKVRFLLTVLDEDKDLEIKKLDIHPEFVKVQLNPLNSKVSKHGIYTLDVEIPKDQQQGNFNRIDTFGKIDLEFDHPRISPLQLKLDFYVL